VIQKKFSLAGSLADDGVEWERRAKETATEAVKVSCEKVPQRGGKQYTHVDRGFYKGRVQIHYRETDQPQ